MGIFDFWIDEDTRNDSEYSSKDIALEDLAKKRKPSNWKIIGGSVFGWNMKKNKKKRSKNKLQKIF
jgi:hypothetical protein